MSEEIDLGANNLCTTEDAFERFQAVSMYQENEFITLSDIIPESETGPDLIESIEDSHDEKDTVSAPKHPQLHVNNVIEPDAHTITQSVVKSEQYEQLDAKAGSEIDSTTRLDQDVRQSTLRTYPAPRAKRGRSKSTVPDNKNTVQEVQDLQDDDKAIMLTGRPKTPNTSEIKSSFNALESDSMPDKSNQGHTSSNSSPGEFKVYSMSTKTTTMPRKRGRPRKANTSKDKFDSPLTEDKQSLLKRRHSQTNKFEGVNYVTQIEKSNVKDGKRTSRVSSKSIHNDNNVVTPTTSKNNMLVMSSNEEKKKDTLESVGKKKRGRPRKQNMIMVEKVAETSSTSIDTLKKKSDKAKNKPKKDRIHEKKESIEDIEKYDRIEKELERLLSTPDLPDDLPKKDDEVQQYDSIPKKKIKIRIKSPSKPAQIKQTEGKKVQIDSAADDEGDNICLSKLIKQIIKDDESITNNDVHTQALLPLNNRDKTNTNECLMKRSSKKPIMPDFEYNIDSVGSADTTNNEDDNVDRDNVEDDSISIKPVEENMENINKNLSEHKVDKELQENVVEELVEQNEHDLSTDINETEIESPTKRPVRRKAKKVMHYDEGSDEDPFANVELSDDEDIAGRRGGRYCSDDEYLPGKENKRGRALSSESSDLSLCDINETNKEVIGKKQGRKKVKKSDLFERKGSGKKNRQSSDVTSTTADTTTQNDEDVEISIQSSDVSTNNDQQSNESWSAPNELENFLAKKIQGTNLQIRKLSGSKTTQNAITPLEIPVLDPTEPKKTIETYTQTSSVCTKTVEVQTSCPYEYTMKTKVPLTAKQSEKACEFLKGIVKTTSELGQLMTQKSEDFIQKKINIKQVTDTCKMDYCVQKSFLLFKLAKHNLIQMEEDLANEYERFLQRNDMLQYRETPKSLTPKPQTSNSDSDCEIVEEPILIPQKKKEKAQFNPKTVFLNKELSIKIAKKSADEPRKDEKLNIKGRHTVWLNDSIMVKKVKPTQSFLAQDSRNKKPPDTFVTVDMVRFFFDSYYKRQQALTLCAPFIGQHYLEVRQETTCNYFINKTLESTPESTRSLILHPENAQTENQSSNNILASNIVLQKLILQPQPLLTICTILLVKSVKTTNLIHEHNCDDVNVCMVHEQYPQPQTLFRLSFNIVLNAMLQTSERNSDTHEVLLRSLNEDNHNGSNYSMQSEQNYQPKTLFQLSLNVVSSTMFMTFERYIYNLGNDFKEQNILKNPLHLKSLCQQRINGLINMSDGGYYILNDTNISTESIYSMQDGCLKHKGLNSEFTSKKHTCMKLKTLLSLCVKAIQRNEFILHTVDMNIKSLCMQPKLLKCISFEKVRESIYRKHSNDKKGAFLYIQDENGWLNKNMNEADQTMSLTIQSVNSVSDDVFLNIPDTSQCSEDENSDFSNENVDMPVYDENNQEDNQTENFNWVSMVQMQELKSCVMPNERISNDFDSFTEEIPSPIATTENSAVKQIKIEPFEETSDVDVNSFVKTEPKDDTVDDNFTPLITKVEREAEYNTSVTACNSYDVDDIESFLRTNKLLHSAIINPLAKQEYFNQSVLIDRMQYEPVVDDDTDMSMSLLVPQSVELVKDRLMESSSDGGTNAQKKVIKKKRKIPSKSKRHDNKNKKNATHKHKNATVNEVAVLTRKMQERIRQEKKQDDSSDSELENPLSLRRDKDAAKIKTYSKTNKSPVKCNKESDNQIQCNDVDSTEQIYENVPSQGKSELRDLVSTERDKKSSKMLTRSNNKRNNALDIEEKSSLCSSIIHPEAPVELLECEPILPIMDDNIEYIQTEDNSDDPKHKVLEREPNISYIERHGWKCYPVDYNDTKLYRYACIQLEKLPETFVETYFKYQGMADKSKNNTDIDRLTNLQSLHRNQPNLSKKNKDRGKIKQKGLFEGQLKLKNTDHNSQSVKSSNDDNYAELMPSEDEGANVDDELPPSASQKDPENVMAKNSLMDDYDSDSEKVNAECVIKKNNNEPPIESDDKINTNPKKDESDQLSNKRKYRPGPKSSKSKTVLKKLNSLMLTADKMMNKELTLLYAPVTLNDDSVNIKDTPKKSSIKNSNRTVSKHQAVFDRVKAEDDSSSEEEKQWVNTKEKLLKKMVKKQGNPSVDDAKRAKIVSEFIERRVDRPECRPRGKRGRRSSKKFLERQKQMSVLKKELFGEVDATHAGRKHYSYGKGRKNIRKVIDKKSLARTTVISNMEEFERKRRLNMAQTRLRELLGFEEGVNVLVINDEVCLEYDFEAMRPVVTIHPFFTKVMKAHQYEGVKFMWDACFESLSMVEAGHPGGGCILAHCMGLGKTLQVLALLHTVLTHPRVGMHRVLVCCPLSTVLNWVDEIHKWIGPVTKQIKVFELSKLKKTYERAYQLEDWYSGGGIFIIGYELFRSLTTLDPILDDVRPTIVNKIRTALLDPGPDVIICDEGHLLKNDSSVLAVAMSRVATRRRIILTGTPMQNNLREYYCMVNFVKPSLLGTYSEYSNRFENPIMNGQHRDSQEEDIKLMKTRTHILHKVLEGCLQRQEVSVLYPYLPKKHEYTVFIPPTKCQWDLYKHYIITYAMQQQQKQSVLKDFHVLQKIWTHPQVLHNFLMKGHDERNKMKMEKIEDDLAQADLAASEDVKPSQTEVWWLQYLEGGDMLDSLESSNKFLVVFQLIEECIALGDKILIFSTSLYTMDALEYFLKRINKWSLGQEYYRLDGSVPAEVRQKWCREFNAENNHKTKLFLISTRAGSLGLNMTAANRVIILDTSWNPAHDIQSIFRVYRFGQKKDCYIYRLVAMGTMEQKIYERSVTKQAVACRVVDEQQIDRHYNMAELTELYRYDEEGSSVEAGLAAGVADVALLRVAARARLHAVREHDSLLRGSREQHLPEHERAAAWFQFQQEHAHTEMQNRLLDENQGIHQIFGHTLNNLSMPSGSTEIKIETGDQPPIAPLQHKGKKKKKSSSDSPPPTLLPSPDPSTSQQKINIFDSEKEESKVKKIMQILIQHNFHATKPATDISQLVANVRKIVADGQSADLSGSDELTLSIAKVLLQEEEDAKTASILANGSGNTDNAPTTDNTDGVQIKKEIDKDATVINDQGEASIVPYLETSVKLTGPRRLTSPPNETVRRSSRRVKPRKSELCTEESILSDRAPSPDKVDEPVAPEVIRKKYRKCKIRSSEPDFTLIEDSNSNMGMESNVVTDAMESTEGEQTKQPKKKISKKSYSNLSRKRTKRKAALVAEKHISSFRDYDVVTLDDDDDDWVADEPNHVEDSNIGNGKAGFSDSTKEVIQTKSTLGEVNTIKKYPKPKRADKLNKISDKTPEACKDINSIVLSDDDEPLASANFAKSKPDKSYSKTNNTPKAEVKTNENVTTEKLIPLHKSLLTNKNFIKIVAHTYLGGNPMLDEDAALLAAQYSTQKALTEIETTGRELTSGAVYDIAVKVLGIDILKKLYDSKGKAKGIKSDVMNKAIPLSTSGEKSNIKDNKSAKTANDIVDQSSRNTADNTLTKSSEEIQVSETEARRMNPTASTSIIKKQKKHASTKPAATSQQSTPKVVPVGMFMGSQYNLDQRTMEAVEESILPDDDDDVIIGCTSESTTSTAENYQRRNSQQFTINNMTSSTKADSERMFVSRTAPSIVTPAQEPQIAPTIIISGGKIISTSSNVANKSSITVPVATTDNVPPSSLSTSSDTICLDSDDEDLTSKFTHNLPPTLPSHKLTSIKPTLTHAVMQAPTESIADMSNYLLPQAVYPVQNNLFNVDKNQLESADVTPSYSISQRKRLNILPHETDYRHTAAASDSNPSVVQTTLKPLTSANGASPLQNAKKICKPGDIVVITKTGALQVLSRVEPNKNHMNSSQKLPQPVTVPVDNGSKLLTTKCDDNTLQETSEIKDSVSQNRKPSASRDHNSIFKDVIHIQADEYEAPKLKTPSEPQKYKSVDAGGLKLIRNIAGTSKASTSKTAIVAPNTISKKDALKLAFKNMAISASQSKTKESASKKVPISSNCSTERKINRGYDLIKSNKSISIKYPETYERTKVSNNILTKGSTPKSKTCLSSKIKSSGSSNKTASKKRSSPWPEASSVKKKTDDLKKPMMTLKDFNLDDFDDIIELE